MLLLLYGLDELGVRRRMQQLRAEADGGTGMLETNLISVEGRDATAQDIIGPAMSPPFLAPARLVVVEAFLNRFEPRGDQRQPRSIAAFEPLFAALEAGIAPSTILVFTGIPPSDPGERDGAFKRNPMIDRLKKIPGATAEEHREMKGQELLRFIKDEAGTRGIHLRSGPFRDAPPDDDELRKLTEPAAFIAALLHGDSLAIVNELDKLALYSMGREVTVDTVALVCSGERDVKGYTFVDAVMDGDHARALGALEALRRDGASSQEILVLLLGGYRRAATMIDLLEGGATPDEVGKAMNMTYPNLRDRAIARGRRLGHPGLKAAFTAIVAADRTNKLGEVDDDLAIDLLVARLASLSPLRQPAAR